MLFSGDERTPLPFLRSITLVHIHPSIETNTSMVMRLLLSSGNVMLFMLKNSAKVGWLWRSPIHIALTHTHTHAGALVHRHRRVRGVHGENDASDLTHAQNIHTISQAQTKYVWLGEKVLFNARVGMCIGSTYVYATLSIMIFNFFFFVARYVFYIRSLIFFFHTAKKNHEYNSLADNFRYMYAYIKFETHTKLFYPKNKWTILCCWWPPALRVSEKHIQYTAFFTTASQHDIRIYRKYIVCNIFCLNECKVVVQKILRVLHL